MYLYIINFFGKLKTISEKLIPLKLPQRIGWKFISSKRYTKQMINASKLREMSVLVGLLSR